MCESPPLINSSLTGYLAFQVYNLDKLIPYCLVIYKFEVREGGGGGSWQIWIFLFDWYVPGPQEHTIVGTFLLLFLDFFLDFFWQIKSKIKRLPVWFSFFTIGVRFRGVKFSFGAGIPQQRLLRWYLKQKINGSSYIGNNVVKCTLLTIW